MSEFSEPEDWLIYISGTNSIQGELLAVFIEKETGLPCRIASGREMFPSRLVPGRGSIIFSNCQNLLAPDIIAGMRKFKQRSKPDTFIIFFNVDRTLNIEVELLKMGLWGVFYEGDSLDSLPFGVESIRKGEIWLSRQVMSDCLINMRRRDDGNKTGSVNESLSGREIEVLKMLSRGLGNEQIADELCITTNTVRSHLYRIFKKIDVSSRHLAAIWASRNL